ncbi:MAG TPA: GNAT family N-acetyltransferase [Gaiellaceae bacterium]|nr:GNAT family N-acetyltransferase [Gaiellaceae bacterium]
MVEIEEIGEDALVRLVDVHNTVWPQDADTVEAYVDWRRQAEDMVWLVASRAKVDVGAGVGIHGWHSPEGVGRLGVHVLAEARGYGIGSALLASLGDWLQARGCREAMAQVAEEDDASLAWAVHRGFAEVGRNPVLALDLATAEMPDVPALTGIEIVAWSERPELARGLYDVYLEAAPDIPGEEEVASPAFEDWLEKDMQGEGDRPEATFVALAGGEVVGYGKLVIPAEGDTAWHDLIGVRRAWRGRGIAGALKREQIRWAKSRGYRWLKTANEERNEPVRRLNLRHGYRQEPGFVTVRGSLTGARR